MKSIIKKLISYECICCGSAVTKRNALFCDSCNKELYSYTASDNDTIISPFNYKSEPVKSLILTMKDYKITELYRFAAKAVADKIREADIPGIDTYTIAFAPRNLRTFFGKGFDQSYEIGKYLSLELFGTKKKCRALFASSIFSKQQKTLTSEERHRNVRDHLRLLPFVTVPENLILLDDVSTTGATLFAMYRLAKLNGARKCLLCSVARQKTEIKKYKRH